jgi:hypothetical protein
MKTYRMNAVMTGILYILGTAFGVAGGLVGGRVLQSLIGGTPLVDVDVLSLAFADSTKITMGALFTFLMGLSLVSMTIFLYPVLRKASKEMAMGLVLFRGALEGVFYFLTAITLLTLVAVSNTYVATGSNSAILQTIGNLLFQIEGLKSPISQTLFVIGGLCIYVVFFRTRLIPRWISVWGFVAVAATLVSSILEFCHINTGIGFYLELVMFPQEIIMAVWLIVKGFNQTVLATLSAKTE